MYPSRDRAHLIAGHLQEALEGDFTTWIIKTRINTTYTSNTWDTLYINNAGFIFYGAFSVTRLLTYDVNGINLEDRAASWQFRAGVHDTNYFTSILGKYVCFLENDDQTIGVIKNGVNIWTRDVVLDSIPMPLNAGLPVFGPLSISPNGKYLLVHCLQAAPLLNVTALYIYEGT